MCVAKSNMKSPEDSCLPVVFHEASSSPYFKVKETWLVHLAKLPHLIPDSLPSVFEKNSRALEQTKPKG